MLWEVLERKLDAKPDMRSGLASICRMFARQLEATDFQLGCPVATVALEASGNEALREACAAVFRGWETRIAGRLMRETPGTARAERLGRAAVALVEGALLLAKTHRSTQSLKDAEALLEQILG